MPKAGVAEGSTTDSGCLCSTRSSCHTGTRSSAHPTPAPLTLDLLVDHQGEVVHLQDARQRAQRVRQADLEERRGRHSPGQPSQAPGEGAQGSGRGWASLRRGLLQPFAGRETMQASEANVTHRKRHWASHRPRKMGDDSVRVSVKEPVRKAALIGLQLWDILEKGTRKGPGLGEGGREKRDVGPQTHTVILGDAVMAVSQNCGTEAEPSRANEALQLLTLQGAFSGNKP